MEFNAIELIDFYKAAHHLMYPENMTHLTSYFTARSSRDPERFGNEVVFFGLQPFIKNVLMEGFKQTFFNNSINRIKGEYTELFSKTLIVHNTKHLEDLYYLGYLPLEIRALNEGTTVPIGVPMIEVRNTVPGFHWLVNYIETMLSTYVWFPITVASISKRIYSLVKEKYAEAGVDTPPENACGDFSMRGMSSISSAVTASMAHLLFFNGSATVPAIKYVDENYKSRNMRDSDENAYRYAEICKGVISTEHSVMTSYGDTEEAEEAVLERLFDIFPHGNLSIVCDSYNYFNIIDNVLPNKFREQITGRKDGRLTIRGDSGNPVDIIVESVKRLHKNFPGEPLVRKDGTLLKRLPDNLRVIYGDGMTYERIKESMERLMSEGYAPDNFVSGIGSYTYNYLTRDIFGMAYKATYAEFSDGSARSIYKAPKTDTGKTKFSHKGCCRVYSDGDCNLHCQDSLTREQALVNNLLQPVFKDGKLLMNYSFDDIRTVARL